MNKEMIQEAHARAKRDNPELYAELEKAMEAVAVVKNLDSGKKWDRVSAPNLQ